MAKKKIEGQIDFFSYQSKSTEEFSPFHFKECTNCWCYDCKHNKYREAKPRDLCGNQIPCPACDECVRKGKAEVCEIGSAKNGCSLRAKEEGINLESSLT